MRIVNKYSLETNILKQSKYKQTTQPPCCLILCPLSRLRCCQFRPNLPSEVSMQAVCLWFSLPQRASFFSPEIASCYGGTISITRMSRLEICEITVQPLVNTQKTHVLLCPLIALGFRVCSWRPQVHFLMVTFLFCFYFFL